MARVSRRQALKLLGTGLALSTASCLPGGQQTQAPPTPATLSPSPTATQQYTSVAPPGERRVLSANPPNYESPLHLVKGFLTPVPLHFVRTHDPVPRLRLEEWRLRVEGNAVERPVELTFGDLLKLPSRSVICFIECAGNGRSFFADLLGRPAEGGQWRLGAISVSEYTGVPLAAVLELAGLRPDARDVLIEGLDQLKINRPIPIEKALDPNTILAYAMNGADIPPDHGYPVRAVVPGWVGINSIKWVGRIEVSNQPIKVATNTTSYILDGPDYPDKPPVTTQNVKSAVALPWDATLPAGRHLIRGFAWSGQGRVIKVEYSLDEGKTWTQATIREPVLPLTWVRWEFVWDARPGKYTIRVRATDERGNTQPDTVPWNRLGYLFNAVVPHPVTVT